MSQEKRIDSLTGIRGMAALLVVYAHLAEDRFFAISSLHPGEIGVMVFFTLSGFLMAFLYGDKPFNYSAAARYGIARFSRIAPAYLTVVLVSYLIFNFVDSNFVYAITHQNLARHLAFSGNVSALWSIPPEVQFYVIFLGLWLALWTLGSRGDAALLVLTLVVIFTLMAYRASLPGTFVGSKIHYFFVGVIFGLLRSRAAAGAGLKALSCMQGAALALVVLVATDSFHIDFGSKREFYLDLLPALFAGAFIFLFSFDTGLSKRLFGSRPITMCGECSFSMYLLNIPVIYVAVEILGTTSGRTPLLALGIGTVVVVAAWTMYRVIELPGNRLLRHLGTRLLLDRCATNEQSSPGMSAVVVQHVGEGGISKSGTHLGDR